VTHGFGDVVTLGLARGDEVSLPCGENDARKIEESQK